MSLLVDEDFQSYSLGATPPLGLFQVANAAGSPSIVNTPGGIYGDVKSLAMGSGGILYPILPSITLAQAQAGVTYANSGVPTYSQASIFWGFRLSGTGSGTILQINNNVNPFQGGAPLRIDILADQTLSFTSSNQRWAITNTFSLLTEKWYWFQVNVIFTTELLGGHIIANVTLAVNNVIVLSGIFTTNIPTTDFPTLYFNNIAFLNAGDGGGNVGRIAIYDAIQSIGSVPHPGSPNARVSQGLIELIRKQGIPTKGLSRIYEA